MRDGGEEHVAPIIPLFGRHAPAAPENDAEPQRDLGHQNTAAAKSAVTDTSVRRAFTVVDGASDRSAQDDGDESERARDHARQVLLRKLRARSLSVSEARTVLRAHPLDSSQVDDVIDEFCDRGYLDDALLAEHLVITGIERKGQGRAALSRSLAQRGIPRDVIEAAMGNLPDDDAERALQFARGKARSLTRLDFDTALRRLVGQLARRGYGGSVAMDAAKTALHEESRGRPTAGVCFVDSD